MDTSQITASVLTLCGAPFPERPRFGALQRAQAAHAVGISSIGVTLDELPLDRRVLRYARADEAEWVDLGERLTPGTVRKLGMALDYGVRRVNVGVCGQATEQDAAKTLAELLGLPLTFAVEPVAFGSLVTISAIRRVLGQCGIGGQAGVLADMWHAWQNGFLPSSLDGVTEVQVCGTRSRRHGYRSTRDASQDRMTLAEDLAIPIDPVDDEDDPGLLRFLELVKGSQVPVSYEVPREDWRQLTALEVAELAAKDLALLA